MKIRELYLKNFRGYHEIKIPFSDTLNVIIGRNDVGKSTILDALEIFFNNETIKVEKEDCRVGESEMIIGVSFEVEPNKKYSIEPVIMTTLEAESLLDNKGLLRIEKRWNCTGANLTTKSQNIYIIANYWKEYEKEPLITLKIGELKNKSKELGIDLKDIDLRIASEIRQTIYNNTLNVEKELIPILTDNEDSKKIYESVSKDFPDYYLFQSDRQNKDSDKDVQDPLKAITKRAISGFVNELNDVVDNITKTIKEQGQKTIDKIRKMDPEIAKTLDPNVSHKNWDSLFNFSFNSDDGIPMNKRGSGVRRLILLNYFRVEAEDNSESKSGDRSIIYAIEEPETSQHPDYQVMLMNALIELANSDNKQVIATTHSPELAKMTSPENLIFIKKDSTGVPILVEDERDKMTSIKETLGILPYLSKLVICVEGASEINFLSNINQNIPELKEIFDINNHNTVIIPLRGGNLKQWVDRDYLRGSNVAQFHLFDSDKGSDHENQYQEECNDVNSRPNCCAVLTEKREIENYISPSLYESYYNKYNFGILKANWNIVDIPDYILHQKCRDVSKLNPRDRKKKEDMIKTEIHENISKLVTKESLIELGAYSEVESWFKKMAELEN